MKFIDQGKDHLIESGWGYWKHLFHSLRQSTRLFSIAILSLIHGIFPWWFASSGPLGVYKIYHEIKKFHHIQKMFKKHDSEQ